MTPLLSRAEYFKFLDVSNETKEVYSEMFSQGLSPSGAHAERRKQIKAEFPDTWHMMCADRSILPSVSWVYYWHRNWMNNTIGSKDGIDAYIKAEEMVAEFDAACKAESPLNNGEYYAKIAQTEAGETAIAIVDPFMRRVHETVPQSGEMVLIDATSNLDRQDSKLFHLVCPSVIGALPVGVIITTREDTDTVRFGLELLKSVLPVYAFYGRGGSLGPQIFMTDDSDSERAALRKTWPGSVLLLCVFHVLQAMWTWLWDSKHGIHNTHRVHLLNLFRAVLYADTEYQRSECLEEMYADEIINEYPQFQKHLKKDTFPKMQAWSIARRVSDNLPTSNNNTNNQIKNIF